MRSIVQAEMIAITQAAIHLDSGDEILRTKSASFCGALQRHGTAGAERVAKFPWLIGKILGGQRVLREVPALERTGKNELELHLVDDFLPGYGIRREKIRLHIMPFAFLQKLVRTALVFVFHVQDRVNKVFSFERSEAVLPANPRENSAVPQGRLAVEIKLGGPPGRGAVFEFHPIRMKVVAAALRAEGREIFDLEVPRFFKVVVVSYKVRIFLRTRGIRKRRRGQNEE